MYKKNSTPQNPALTPEEVKKVGIISPDPSKEVQRAIIEFPALENIVIRRSNAMPPADIHDFIVENNLLIVRISPKLRFSGEGEPNFKRDYNALFDYLDQSTWRICDDLFNLYPEDLN